MLQTKAEHRKKPNYSQVIHSREGRFFLTLQANSESPGSIGLVDYNTCCIFPLGKLNPETPDELYAPGTNNKNTGSKLGVH